MALHRRDALHRRQALRLAGATALASLSGCASRSFLGSDDQSREYTLTVDQLTTSPVADALYAPGEDALFGDPARTALDAILPDGRYTTYGFTPLSADDYVEHEGTYFQTKQVVTGRRRMARQLVRADPVPEDAVPDDALLVDSLDRPSARVAKILHSHAHTGGRGSSADILRGDAYVLRRPAEVDSAIGTGALDGRVVTMTDSGTWAYRLRVNRERIRETAHTVLAVEVADSREGFREVVFGSRVDAELGPADLSSPAREMLAEAIARERYAETTPLSEGFEELLGVLALRDVDGAATGRRLWYDGGYYRYALYINDPS